MKLDQENLNVRWTLGRVAFAEGDVSVAADAFEGLGLRAISNPLLLVDSLAAFMRAGRFNLVDDLYRGLPASAGVLPSLPANYALWQAAESAGDANRSAVYG
ncbi:MAG: hypothetical protein IMZ50_08345, partial [Candidatus Atribacteria bacterium]|nr:hypothetical protein [Candidatus Atribacteria bacterium]